MLTHMYKHKCVPSQTYMLGSRSAKVLHLTTPTLLTRSLIHANLHPHRLTRKAAVVPSFQYNSFNHHPYYTDTHLHTQTQIHTLADIHVRQQWRQASPALAIHGSAAALVFRPDVEAGS